ncbi:MAG: hypothetical protein ACNA8K_04720 [Cyclonatronaceae bacterium]
MINSRFFHLILLTSVCAFLFVYCEEQQQASEYDPGESRFAMGDTLVVTGTLIDAHCYALDKSNTGHDHQLPQSGFRENCAEYCALQGYPVAVLFENEQGADEVWSIMTTPLIFADYMIQTVRVKGTVRTDGVLDPLSVELMSGPDEWITIM